VSLRLRQALGAQLGLDPGHIVVGNGSDELIDLILRLFRPGPEGGGIGQVVNCPPTFGMYQFYGATNDMQVLDVPRGADFELDVAGIEALFAADPQPRVIFVTSPNNPDGLALADADLERLLALPALVVLDEAYVEFSGNSRVGWVAQRENLIVLRTFSKWAGLAGLRVGYGVFPQVLMTAVWRMKSPYNVNGAAQTAALATLKHLDEAMISVQALVQERTALMARLREIPFLKVYESQANYVLCRVVGLPVAQVRQAMEQRGIILRYFGTPGLDDCIRFTVGTPMQDTAVLMALRGLLAEGGSNGK
jgi:histidinol-phosphate aminotransferase